MSILYLYLDESGDLGFDFVNTKPSKFFTITILAIEDKYHKLLTGAITKTLKRKINHKNKKNVLEELKGTNTRIEVKTYFYSLVKDIPFSLFSITLNKQKLYETLTRDKSRVYNFIAQMVLKKIKLHNANKQIEFIVDKSKGNKAIKEFDQYIINQIEGKIDPLVPMNIKHFDSKEYKGLQAADLFCWGVFRTYEKNDSEWFDIFKDKVKVNEKYL